MSFIFHFYFIVILLLLVCAPSDNVRAAWATTLITHKHPPKTKQKQKTWTKSNSLFCVPAYPPHLLQLLSLLVPFSSRTPLPSTPESQPCCRDFYSKCVHHKATCTRIKNLNVDHPWTFTAYIRKKKQPTDTKRIVQRFIKFVHTAAVRACVLTVLTVSFGCSPYRGGHLLEHGSDEQPVVALGQKNDDGRVVFHQRQQRGPVVRPRCWFDRLAWDWGSSQEMKKKEREKKG